MCISFAIKSSIVAVTEPSAPITKYVPPNARHSSPAAEVELVPTKSSTTVALPRYVSVKSCARHVVRIPNDVAIANASNLLSTATMSAGEIDCRI